MNIVERIKNNRLWDFPGGVFPKGNKNLSNGTAIAEVALPDVLYIPLKQHLGAEGKIAVTVGEKVLKGQALTSSGQPLAVPVHAPTSGHIANIVQHVSAHASGRPELTIELCPDKQEQWVDLTPVVNYQTQSKTDVVGLLCQAGIAGLGGAGFPTHIKMATNRKIQYLVINGIECEPYITADDRLMREHAWQIRQGIEVLVHLLGAEHVLIAIEDNKPEALKAMRAACQEVEQFCICAVPTKYPAGGEKQLIQVLTGEQVPKGKYPIDMGIVVQNVATCYAVADAIFAGKPLLQRVVTLTGRALAKPQNVWALLGTPIQHLLQETGYQRERQMLPDGQPARVIMGGPMMGFTVASERVPVVKITNCLLVPDNNELPKMGQELPCIRCGSCADACPAELLPQQLYWHSKAGELEKLQAFDIFDCIECGACAFVCPSEIPLVHYYRKGKAEIRIQQAQKDQADKSKVRFNARQQRLARDKQERESKRQRSAAARQASVATPATTTSAEPLPATTVATPSASGQPASKVAAAIARAKAKRAAANGGTSNTPAPTATAKKSTNSAATSSAGTAVTDVHLQTTASQQQDPAAAAAVTAAQPSSEQLAMTQTTTGVSTAPATPERQVVPASLAGSVKNRREQALTGTDRPAPQPHPSPGGVSTAADVAANKGETPIETEQARRKRVDAAIAKAKARRAAREHNNKNTEGQ